MLAWRPPWCFFEKSRLWAGTGFSPSPFLSSSSSHTTQTHYTYSYTYSHPNLNFLQYTTETRPTHNVVCPNGAQFENRPQLMPSIHLVWNPKRIIVHWVGIRTHTHTISTLYAGLSRHRNVSQLALVKMSGGLKKLFLVRSKGSIDRWQVRPSTHTGGLREWVL